DVVIGVHHSRKRRDRRAADCDRRTHGDIAIVRRDKSRIMPADVLTQLRRKSRRSDQAADFLAARLHLGEIAEIQPAGEHVDLGEEAFAIENEIERLGADGKTGRDGRPHARELAETYGLAAAAFDLIVANILEGYEIGPHRIYSRHGMAASSLRI